ncbi:MAG: hypothetical protein U0L49_03270 [Eubacterium sp.]|nr:hypothetical protein [Eubacterium sp.]
MTLKQEAYREIDRLSDEDIRFVITFMRKIQPSNSRQESKAEGKTAFLASAGKIDINEEAVTDLRNRSMI